MKTAVLNFFAVSFLFCAICSFSVRSDQTVIDEVLLETNAFRKANGLPPLQVSQALNTIAGHHSDNMANGNVRFGHSGFEKRSAMALKQVGEVSSVAENVAFGAATGTDAVAMWKASDGHRRNMLGKFRFVGIGVAKDRHGRIYYTQVFAG